MTPEEIGQLDRIRRQVKADTSYGGAFYDLKFLLNLYDRVMERLRSNGWTNIEERLPKKYQDCLFYGRTYFIIENFDPEEFTPIQGRSTHWQPLPEPPKEDEE